MNKLFALFILGLVLLAGCAKQQIQQPAQPPAAQEPVQSQTSQVATPLDSSFQSAAQPQTTTQDLDSVDQDLNGLDQDLGTL